MVIVVLILVDLGSGFCHSASSLLMVVLSRIQFKSLNLEIVHAPRGMLSQSPLSLVNPIDEEDTTEGST
jgi:hypothetical protein